MTPINELDSFTRAYIEAMLWSSTTDPYGTCPQCGKDDQILCQWNDGQEHVCSDCSTREPNYEPPTDQNYSIDDLAPGTLERIVKDCREFQEQNGETITDTECNRGSGEYDKWEQAGHDFWLTRCGHGAGFWDGDWSESAGKELSDAADRAGELSLYVGDDGKLYF